MEDELGSLELLLLASADLVVEGVGKPRRELEDGRGRTREGVALLTEEDVVVLPIGGDGEALVKTTVFVGLGEELGCVHEVLACDG
jgi:hypothetical protein